MIGFSSVAKVMLSHQAEPGARYAPSSKQLINATRKTIVVITNYLLFGMAIFPTTLYDL
jgi:hypothetical protein